MFFRGGDFFSYQVNECWSLVQNYTQTEESLKPTVNVAWRVKFNTTSKYINIKYRPKFIESLMTSSSPTSCSKQSQHWMHTTLFRASAEFWTLFSWVLKTSDKEYITASLGTLIQCFIILMGIFFSFIQSDQSLSVHDHGPLFSCLPLSFWWPSHKHRWLLGFPTAIPSPSCANPNPQPPLIG